MNRLIDKPLSIILNSQYLFKEQGAGARERNISTTTEFSHLEYKKIRGPIKWLLIFSLYYLTDPIIPATKCLCIRKNTSAVGIVAITIASMMIPKSGE